MTSTQRGWLCPIALNDFPRIVMGHGGGGQLTSELFEHLIRPALENPILVQMADAAVLPAELGRLVFSTDSYVVRPLFFPGGSIAELAVHGTINDLAMMGAFPRYLSLGLVLEEGLPMEILGEILQRIGHAARLCGVQVVTGDTKVIERHTGEGCFIHTSGIGVLNDKVSLSVDAIEPGDAILISGSIAEHGLAVLGCREMLEFESTITSDTAPLHELVQVLLSEIPVRMLRDPTRGGLAATLNEIAATRQLGIDLFEESIPITPSVRAACELLGLDPLTIANEGKLVAVIPAAYADRALEILQGHPLGKQAANLGSVVEQHPGYVVAHTPYHSTRIIPMPAGELLPRIC
jgi:hydrogenase expression/formation protein HypE